MASIHLVLIGDNLVLDRNKFGAKPEKNRRNIWCNIKIILSQLPKIWCHFGAETKLIWCRIRYNYRNHLVQKKIVLVQEKNQVGAKKKIILVQKREKPAGHFWC